jgi:uncharacterized protein YyaL (SSP411 family)
MVESLSHLIQSEPGFMSYWAIVYTELKKGMAEVVFVGKDIESLRNDFQRHYLPYTILQGTSEDSDLPLVKDKTATNGKATIYVCYNKTCKLPVHTVDEAIQQVT